jgi:hypothetical protein
VTEIQLALELHPDAVGEVTELGDIDPAKADAAMDRLLEAVRAASARPRPCRCERPLLLDEDEATHCCRCGREAAP